MSGARRRTRRPDRTVASLVAALVALAPLTACGADDDPGASSTRTSAGPSTSPSTSGSPGPTATTGATSSSDPSAARAPWCEDLLAASAVLANGGTVADYEALLARVAATGPPEFAPTWELLLAASAEPFSYDTFNPAVDALDRITADVVAVCPWFGGVVVDDHGRLHR